MVMVSNKNRCGMPHPKRKRVWCQHPRGHKGPHEDVIIHVVNWDTPVKATAAKSLSRSTDAR